MLLSGETSMMRIADRCRTLAVLLLPLLVWLTIALQPIAPAQAASLTPEASRYQIDRGDSKIQINTPGIKSSAQTDAVNKTDTEAESENLFEAAKQKLEETKDTVVEKLNLNEPLPPSTKLFIEQVKDQLD